MEWLRLEWNLWRSSGPAGATKSTSCRPMVRWLFNISKDGDPTTSLGSLCHCSVSSQWEGVSWCPEEISCGSVCAHCLWLCQWALLRRVWLHPLCILSLPWTFFSLPSWTVPALSALPHGDVRPSTSLWPFTGPSPVHPCPELDTPLLVWPHQCWEGEDHTPHPDSNTMPNTVQDTMYLLCSKSTLLANVQPSVSTKTCRSFSAKLLSSLLLCSCFPPVPSYSKNSVFWYNKNYHRFTLKYNSYRGYFS